MAIAERDIEHYLQVSIGFAKRAEVEADWIERERRLPPELAAGMAEAGLFRLLVPRSLGGAELNLLDFMRVLEISSCFDASTAWCLNQNNVFATNATRIPLTTAQEIWSDSHSVVTNGPPEPGSLATPVDGGYRLSGRWNFSSGIRHANWVAALAPVGSPDAVGKAMTDPDSGVVLLIPKEDVEVIDAWQVSGLRGTGSFSFAVNDLFVPTERTYGVTDAPRDDGAIYLIPTVLVFAAGFGTVALGVARSALDTAIGIAHSKTPVMGRRVLRDSSAVQRQIGEAEAVWGSAKAFLREAVAELWQAASDNHSLTPGERIKLRLAGTHAIRKAAEVVDVAYSVAGSNSVFDSNPIQRRFQDIHVITQQAQGRLAHYDTAGAFYLGLDAQGFF